MAIPLCAQSASYRPSPDFDNRPFVAASVSEPVKGRCLLGLAILLLLFPSGQAAQATTLYVLGLDAQGGALAGGFAGTWWDPAGPDDIELPEFAITAERLDILVMHSNKTWGVDGVGEPLPTQVKESHDWHNLTGAQASGARGDADDARVLALPGAPASAAVYANGALTRLVPSGGRDLAFAPVAGTGEKSFPNPDPPGTYDYRIAAASAIQVDPVGHGMLRLTGSFRLVVTGLDLVLASDQGPFELHTRTTTLDRVGKPGDLVYVRDLKVHEAILHLTGASVLIPVDHAYFATPVLSDADAVSFQGATGVLHSGSQSHTLDGADVRVTGAFETTLRRTPEGRVQADLQGTVSAPGLDADTASTKGVLPVAPWQAAAFAAFAMAAAVVHVALGRSRFRRMDAAMDRGQYAEALALTDRFALHPRLVQDAVLARAVCLLAVGKPAEALRELDARNRWAVHRRAMRDFLAARAEAALGRTGAAVRRLAVSLAANPTLLPEAQLDPVLAPLLRAAQPGPSEAYA